MAESDGQRVPQPVDEPLLAVEVVHRERPARGEVLAGGLDRLLGEQITLQSQSARSGHQGQESGNANKIRSYFLSVRSRNARPSLT